MSARYLARSPRLAARTLGGEKVIMSADDSSLYVLNEVATALWDAADGRTTLEDIVERAVCARFEVDKETALRDAAELVAGLAARGILLVSEQPLPPGEEAQ
jgi:hypothetical protein